MKKVLELIMISRFYIRVFLKKKNIKQSFLMVVLGLTLTTCTNSKETNSQITARNTIPHKPTTNEDLFDKEWDLFELNGTTIVLDTSFQKKPHVIFEKGNHLLYGNLGCNGFRTNVEFEDAGQIKLGDIAATEMACQNLEIEHTFLDALKQTVKYELNEDVLSFKNADHETVARLRN